MTKVKEQSTWNLNKGISETTCPVTYAINKVSGHWKPIILYHLIAGPKRFSELKRAIPTITEKMLAQHLKQLVGDNLVDKKVEQIMPICISKLKIIKSMATVLIKSPRY